MWAPFVSGESWQVVTPTGAAAPCHVSTNSLRRVRKRAHTVVKENWLPRDTAMRTKGMALPVKGANGALEPVRGRPLKAAADGCASSHRRVDGLSMTTASWLDTAPPDLVQQHALDKAKCAGGGGGGGAKDGAILGRKRGKQVMRVEQMQPVAEQLSGCRVLQPGFCSPRPEVPGMVSATAFVSVPANKDAADVASTGTASPVPLAPQPGEIVIAATLGVESDLASVVSRVETDAALVSADLHGAPPDLLPDSSSPHLRQDHDPGQAEIPPAELCPSLLSPLPEALSAGLVDL
jgi:hypothetical protein